MTNPASRMRRCGGALAGWLAAAWLALPAAPAPAQDVPFDHFRSRFPLAGAHERVDCERCHGGGVFTGTPTRCESCHAVGSGRADTGKDVGHIRSTDDCDSCHLMNAWAPSRVDHDSVLGDCATCHDGRSAEGRPPGHPPSSNRCEECHGTISWASARFDHTGITGGCATCHNGVDATGKSPGHPPSSNLCEDCHTTQSWLGARFDHTGITSGCASCHNGTDATGMPLGHFQTTQPCEVCHAPMSWLSIGFRHSSPNYPGDHRGPPPCQACHTGNSETIAWPAPTYQPDCAGCHANDYDASHHKKVDSPRILYTVSELRDCSGACHEYTDATFTTIQRTRTGQHRASDGGF